MIFVFADSFRRTVFALALTCALTQIATQSAPAQTLTVLHNFTGGSDGASPVAGVILDAAGNVYGTAQYGGIGDGVVFKVAHRGSGWVFTPLYTFQGGSDGSAPMAGLVFGPDGSLYGATQNGGGGPCSGFQTPGCGTVFKLSPPATACKTVLCPWTETVLYRFEGGSDASFPTASLTFDAGGNLYGTTFGGGAYGDGTVYELAHSNGGWNESILFSFRGSTDGGAPRSEVIFDAAGNLYGTTPSGGQGCYGSGCGVVYELSHTANGWLETVLYSFSGDTDGAHPFGRVIFDTAGNLYGTTIAGGTGPEGTVFQLSPSHGSWVLNTLYDFTPPYTGPYAGLTMDKAGVLYGTAFENPNGWGSVFQLAASGGSWAFSYLNAFNGKDGGEPYDSVALDSAGDLYGSTNVGGTGQACMDGCGVVWQLSPN